MNPKILGKAKTKIDALRAKKANIRAGELLRLASKLEMKPRSSSNSGGHSGPPLVYWTLG